SGTFKGSIRGVFRRGTACCARCQKEYLAASGSFLLLYGCVSLHAHDEVRTPELLTARERLDGGMQREPQAHFQSVIRLFVERRPRAHLIAAQLARQRHPRKLKLAPVPLAAILLIDRELTHKQLGEWLPARTNQGRGLAVRIGGRDGDRLVAQAQVADDAIPDGGGEILHAG